MTKDILIIGGTSGLGLELAQIYADLGHHVTITGRADPKKANVKFLPFNIDADAQSLS